MSVVVITTFVIQLTNLRTLR